MIDNLLRLTAALLTGTGIVLFYVAHNFEAAVVTMLIAIVTILTAEK